MVLSLIRNVDLSLIEKIKTLALAQVIDGYPGDSELLSGITTIAVENISNRSVKKKEISNQDNIIEYVFEIQIFVHEKGALEDLTDSLIRELYGSLSVYDYSNFVLPTLLFCLNIQRMNVDMRNQMIKLGSKNLFRNKIQISFTG